MGKFAIGLLSAAALATTFVLVRQQREVVVKEIRSVAAAAVRPADFSLERIREAGL